MAPGSAAPAERVAVVGGGVIGLAVGLALADRGRAVVVLDRGPAGGGATAAAGGMLAPLLEAETEPAELVDYARESLALYPEWVARLESCAGRSCGYRSEGTLWVAFDRDDLAELEHLSASLAAKGLAPARLSAERARELEPHLSHRVQGALLAPGDHQVDPRALAACLAAAVEAQGGVVAAGSRVDEVAAGAAGVEGVRGRRADGTAFEIAAGAVVVAAGAWAARDLRMPVGRLGLRPVKGQLVRLRGPRLLTRVVRTADVYLIPRADGELLIGATMEEMGFDVAPTAGAVHDLLRHAWEALPGIYDLRLAEVSVGLRSAVDDQLPVVGEVPGVRGLFLALGHFRNGVLLAPATARDLARWIVDGRPPRGIAPFRPERLWAADGAQADRIPPDGRPAESVS